MVPEKNENHNGEIMYVLKEKEKPSFTKAFCEITTAIAAFGTMVAAFVGIFHTIPSLINNSNKQTQVVIEPREGDIIVQDEENYKLLQLIQKEDIIFPSQIQEVQFTHSNSKKERVDINNPKKDDWTKRDSFVYVIPSFSINSNKIINLIQNLQSIKVFVDFYESKNISTYIELGLNAFMFEIAFDKEEINSTVINKESQYEYVTNEGFNDGIEWTKIRVEISYFINGKTINDSISTDWIETTADLFA